MKILRHSSLLERIQALGEDVWRVNLSPKDFHSVLGQCRSEYYDHGRCQDLVDNEFDLIPNFTINDIECVLCEDEPDEG